MPDEKSLSFGAAILAGGVGHRMGRNVPKQFLDIGGYPMIAHTIAAFALAGLFESIVVAIHSDWLHSLQDILESLLRERFLIRETQAEHPHGSPPGLTDQSDIHPSQTPKQQKQTEAMKGFIPPIRLVKGGPTRQASSYAAISALAAGIPKIDAVLIHDAARCLVDRPILERCVEGVKRYGAVTTATSAVDTMAEVEDSRVVAIPDRFKLKNVQTPQGFLLELILEAHRHALDSGVTDASDDARLVLDIRHPVHIVEGSQVNLKVSTLTDLAIAEGLLKLRDQAR